MKEELQEGSDLATDWEALHREVSNLSSELPEQTYLLYAMGLRLSTLDYEDLKTNCLLDGPDDKKVDFFNLDLESGVATIAQGYQSEDWSRREAPANKASDLNTGINWLLESNLEDIPRPAVRAAAEELRDNLRSGDVTSVEVFFVHNLSHSDNVDQELGTAQRALNRLLERYTDSAGSYPRGLVRQADHGVVDDWRRSQHEAVSVHDEITLTSTMPPQSLGTSEWQAVTASVPAHELVDLRTKYGDALFSANVRDYLGSRQAARNINRQIERTVQQEPHNFWVYNNGITLLTNSVAVDEDTIRLSGIAVINGAQTTGSLAEAAAQGSLGDAQVFVRAIKCNNQSLIDSVIRYNNTQNPIKAWELRVIDPIQRRIREDFENIGVTYQLRRGSARRRASDVHYDKLGPFLSAFYGDPIAAHKNKAELFENESTYRSLFGEDTYVRNLLFVYRLGNAVALAKAGLREKVNAETATQDEKAKYEYFRYGAFAFSLIHICAEVLGLWLAPQDTRFKRRVTFDDQVLFDHEHSEALLAKLAETLLGPIHMFLSGKDAYQILKTQEGVNSVAAHAKAIVEQVHHMRPDTYDEFVDHLVLLQPTA
jgi:hypothetical protein